MGNEDVVIEVFEKVRRAEAGDWLGMTEGG